MKKIKDGGPAFSAAAFDKNDNVLEWQSGMSLRDYFAAKVLQGFCADPNYNWSSTSNLAVRCYDIADAMLEARGMK